MKQVLKFYLLIHLMHNLVLSVHASSPIQSIQIQKCSLKMCLQEQWLLYDVGDVSTGIKYFKNHCTEAECLSPSIKFLLFSLLSQGKRRDYRSLGWPSPDECLKLRRVELTTVASTWLAVSAKNIEWVSWIWALSKLLTQNRTVTWCSVCVNWRFYVSKKETPGFLRSLKMSWNFIN